MHTIQKFLEELSFSEAIDYILENPKMLRVSIKLNENNLYIDYKMEELRVFF